MKISNDLIENCMLGCGVFYYKELPSLQRLGNNTLLLESLAIAYELTGDVKYLKPGIKTFDKTIDSKAATTNGAKKIVDDAKAKSKEIRTATNVYSDSILKTTEETLSSQLDIVKKTREKFSEQQRTQKKA